MAVAFFIAPYESEGPSEPRGRHCAMNDFTPAIRADGGDWRESEFLGNRALVKVSASAATLTAIGARFFRFPLAALDNPLSSLNNAQRNAIRTQVTDAGYPLSELNAAIPDLANATVGQVLRFLLRRRINPRFDGATETILFDTGEVVLPTPIEVIDGAVR